MKQRIRIKKGLLILGFLIFLGINIYFMRNAGEILAVTQADLLLELKEGQTEGAPLFSQKGKNGAEMFWEPGREESGVIALKNNYSQSVKLVNVGLTLKLERLRREGEYRVVSDPVIYQLYAENMQLLLSVLQEDTAEKTICNQSFSHLLYEADNSSRQGFTIPSSKTIVLGKSETLYLEYRVKMSEEADNRLQGLKATVDFLVNIKGREQEQEQEQEQEEDSFRETSDHWAHKCILTLVWQGIIPKYSSEIIRADHPLTRGEAAELLVRALNLEYSINHKSPYLDPLPLGQQKYIIAATKKGIFRGYPGGKFLPYKPITREELMCILIRAFELKPQGPCWLNFIDKEQISKWALPDVLVGVQHQVIVGYPDHSFRPQANITRAEAFTIVCRLLGLHIDDN